MATHQDHEYHLERARSELDCAYRAEVRRAAESHLRLSALHMERLKLAQNAHADGKSDDRDDPATGGRVVKTPGENEPYKVVLEHEDGDDSEHPVGSVRDGEELIRKETPVPSDKPKRDSWNP